MSVIEELAEGRTHLGAATLLELRPQLGTVDQLVQAVDGVQRAQGYRLVGAFDDDADTDTDEAVSVAGFRQGDNLALGSYLYIDDLVTRATHRGRGHAAALLEWVAEEAGRMGCTVVHLDSATHRHDAHRRYLASQYRIAAFHFVRDL